MNSLIILSKVRIVVASGGTRVCSGNMCATHVLAKDTSNSCLVKALALKNEMTRQTTGQMYHPDQNDIWFDVVQIVYIFESMKSVIIFSVF